MVNIILMQLNIPVLQICIAAGVNGSDATCLQVSILHGYVVYSTSPVCEGLKIGHVLRVPYYPG